MGPCSWSLKHGRMKTEFQMSRAHCARAEPMHPPRLEDEKTEVRLMRTGDQDSRGASCGPCPFLPILSLQPRTTP